MQGEVGVGGENEEEMKTLNKTVEPWKQIHLSSGLKRSRKKGDKA